MRTIVSYHYVIPTFNTSDSRLQWATGFTAWIILIKAETLDASSFSNTQRQATIYNEHECKQTTSQKNEISIAIDKVTSISFGSVTFYGREYVSRIVLIIIINSTISFRQTSINYAKWHKLWVRNAQTMKIREYCGIEISPAGFYNYYGLP